MTVQGASVQRTFQATSVLCFGSFLVGLALSKLPRKVDLPGSLSNWELAGKVAYGVSGAFGAVAVGSLGARLLGVGRRDTGGSGSTSGSDRERCSLSDTPASERASSRISTSVSKTLDREATEESALSDISPSSSAQGESSAIEASQKPSSAADTVRGLSSKSQSDQEVESDIAFGMGRSVGRIVECISKADEEISNALEAFRKAIPADREALSDSQRQKLITQWRNALDKLDDSMDEAGLIARALRKRMPGREITYGENISEALASVDGKIRVRVFEKLTGEVKGLIKQVNALMSDLSNYGLLCQGGQAEAKRPLGAKLEDRPEVTQIWTRLDRVSNQLDEARTEYPNAPLLRHDLFREELVELLREVKEFSSWNS